jgi:hypothetical protein
MIAWEPWQQKEGDRVRINVSPECRTFHLGRRGGGLVEAFRSQAEKRLINNGEIGVVVKITEPATDESAADAAHRFYVSDGKPGPSAGWDDFYAACELEPVMPPAPEAAGREEGG